MGSPAQPSNGTSLDDARVPFDGLQLAIEAAGLGTFDLDLQSRTVTLSARAARIFGVATEAPVKIAQETLQQRLLPGHREAFESAIAAAAQRPDGVLEAQLHVLGGDGSVRRVTPRGRVLFDLAPDGQRHPRRVIGVVADDRPAEISSALEAHAALAVEAAQVGLYEWTPGDDRAVWSEIMRRLHGLGPGEAPSLAHGLACIHPDDVQRVKEAMAAGLDPAGPGRFEVEYRVSRASPARWIESIGSVQFEERDGRRTPVRLMGAAIDVTARKQVESALREAARRKDEFLAMLGHELRNPLAPLRTASELIRCRGLQPQQLYAMQEMIARQVGHLARLVDDLLDTARIGYGKIALSKAPVELEPLLAATIDECRPVSEPRGQRIRLEAPQEPVWIEGDPVRVTQIVMNLLHNACKFSDNGAEIVLTLASEANEAAIEVLDHGKGIPATLLPHVFELFAQGEDSSNRETGGLGLGLALVHNLVALHSGRVTAASDGPGKGSRFEVRLPLIAPPAQARRDYTTAGPATSKRLLVVDDNADASETLKMMLEMSGQEVLTAASGEEALATFERWKPDIVLVDIGLPDIDGYEVARRLRARPLGRDVMLVALTGYGSSEDRKRSLDAGFDRHLVKPVDPGEIFAVLRSGVEAKREPMAV